MMTEMKLGHAGEGEPRAQVVISRAERAATAHSGPPQMTPFGPSPQMTKRATTDRSRRRRRGERQLAQPRLSVAIGRVVAVAMEIHYPTLGGVSRQIAWRARRPARNLPSSARVARADTSKPRLGGTVGAGPGLPAIEIAGRKSL